MDVVIPFSTASCGPYVTPENKTIPEPPGTPFRSYVPLSISNRNIPSSPFLCVNETLNNPNNPALKNI